MLPEIAAVIEPLGRAVVEAEHDLADVNGDSTAHPLDSLQYAGRLIKAQAALIDACWRLLDDYGSPLTEEDRLRIHGRIRAADTLASEGKHGS